MLCSSILRYLPARPIIMFHLLRLWAAMCAKGEDVVVRREEGTKEQCAIPYNKRHLQSMNHSVKVLL